MSKISVKRRKFEIKRKKERRRKLKKLKEKYFVTTNKEEKERIIEKIKKIAPHLSIEEYLGIKQK